MLPILLWLAVFLGAAELELLPQERAELAGRPATEELLKERTERLVQEWRADPKKADRPQALLLYWYRGPLLSDEDREFLKSLNPVELGAVSGATAPQGSVLPPKAAAGKTAPPPSDLLARLKSSLIIDDHGKKEEAAAIEAGLKRMLESPFAREVAEEFVAQKTKVKISFEPLKSQLVNLNTSITGTHGEFHSGGSPPHVKLSAHYLQTPESYRAAAVPVTIAHELLGHGLEHLRARKLGVDDVFPFYSENETNARLVGWIVEAERGQGWGDSMDELYLRDPDRYRQQLKTISPVYAAALDLDEMQDPVTALKATKAGVDKDLAAARAGFDNFSRYRKAADHFMDAHKVPMSRLEAVMEVISGQLKYLSGRVSQLGAIAAELQKRLTWYATPDGKKHLSELAKDSESPFFEAGERRIQRRVERLQKLHAAKPPPAPVVYAEEIVIIAPRPGARRTAPSPPPPAEITWEDFVRLVEKDKRENPGHYK